MRFNRWERRWAPGKSRVEPKVPVAAGPEVCVLYESECEREELLGRLERAGLGELPCVFVDVGPRQKSSSRWAALSGCPWRVAKSLGAGAVIVATSLGSRWLLVAVVVLATGPLFLIYRAVRGLTPGTPNPV